jgi:trk system potassium uptake protein TrkH
MRVRAVLKALGYLLVVFSASFVLPIGAGLWFGEDSRLLVEAYLFPALAAGLSGAVIAYLNRAEEELRDREAFITVAAAWLLISLLGALPFIISGAITDFPGAFFESTSGFTTTGASVIPDLEDLSAVPRSILMWRATTHLMGGMGIIVLSMVVLSRVVGGSTQLFRAEASAHTSIRMRPTIRQIAITLWSIYLAFTGIEILLLWLAGMGPFDAVCHSFATLATGGFSTKNVGAAYYNAIPAIGALMTFFMVLGGMNFVFHYQWLTGKVRSLRREPEFKLYVAIIGVASAIIFAALVSGGAVGDRREAFAHSVFQTVSIMTTTGFGTADFTTWPSAAQFMLVVLMIIGACSGSTSGGVKVVRFVVLAKMLRREIQKVIHPRAVMPITLGDRPISQEVQSNVMSFFFIYIGIFCLIALGLAFLGMTLVEAITSSASALGNVGPALGTYGPFSNFGSLHPAAKVIMAIAMWIGRLEVYPALLMLSPSAYRR